MPSLQWIQHAGKRILYTDIASQNTEELLDIVELIKAEIKNEPPNSLLCLCNVKNGKTNAEINKGVKDLVKFVDPYMKMIVVIGLDGLQKILYNSVRMFIRNKNLTVKNSREEALAFLVEQ